MNKRDDPVIQATVNRLAWMEDDRRDFASWMQGHEDVFGEILKDTLAAMDAEISEEREILDQLKWYTS